ncbi:hypothetical protein M758_7G076900 [Ceratodon purpureus]|nr:hypothetical protein M758_7G076900 [Ceratodon purpureus]
MDDALSVTAGTFHSLDHQPFPPIPLPLTPAPPCSSLLRPASPLLLNCNLPQLLPPRIRPRPRTPRDCHVHCVVIVFALWVENCVVGLLLMFSCCGRHSLHLVAQPQSSRLHCANLLPVIVYSSHKVANIENHKL